MARNEKKFGYTGLKRTLYAQSTLEFALVFPMLLLLILGIMELAFMWHQYNSVELAAEEISANLALTEDFGCSVSDEALEIIKRKTDFLQEREMSFNVQTVDNIVTYTSNERYRNNPFVIVKVDCSSTRVIGQSSAAQSVQVQAAHKLHFFAASLPNFRTGHRIVIIPDSVMLVSSKHIEIARN